MSKSGAPRKCASEEDMARRTVSFRQSDLTRAIRAATKAGIKVARVDITLGGQISVFAETAPGIDTSDAVDKELEAFREKHPWYKSS